MSLDPVAKSMLSRGRRSSTGRKKPSEYVGEIDERRGFDAVVRISRTYQGDFGIRCFQILEDLEGNTLKHSGTKPLGSEGKRIRFVATVVGHTTHNGFKQTVIQRPAKIEKFGPVAPMEGGVHAIEAV